MIVLVPYFGDLAKFRPLLDRWVESYVNAIPSKDRRYGVEAVLLSDEPGVVAVAEELGVQASVVDASGFADLIRPSQPFDRKGAIVCSWLLEFPYPALVLDADAFLARDPRPGLAALLDAPVAMAVDHGAIVAKRRPTLSPPFAGVRKLCAGVQYFGAERGGRSRLVAGYRRAFEEIVALPELPWDPPLAHLAEQYAWSVVAARRGGRLLSPLFNWSPAFLGPNPSAIVNHHYGHPKWRTGLPEATPASA